MEEFVSAAVDLIIISPKEAQPLTEPVAKAMDAGIPVIVKETTQEALDRGMATIRKNYASSVKKGKLSQAAMDQRLALITPQLTYDGFDRADIIAEAVF